MAAIKRDSVIAGEALPYLLILAAVFLLGLLFLAPAAGAAALLFILVAFFFRNPERRIPVDENSALAPADGKVMAVELVEDNLYFPGRKMWRVSIFLSLLNVHFNRAPVAGLVKKTDYVPGSFLPAFKSHAAADNERNYLLLAACHGDILVAQITGFLARRIVCWAKAGDYLAQGERFGLIKFGSASEIYLPAQFSVEVKKGDKVKGGVTVIGRYRGDQASAQRPDFF